MTEILMLAYDYVEDIKKTNEYKKLVWLNENLDNLYHDEIKIFKAKQKEYNDVLEIGIYHPDFKRVTAEFSKIKQTLYEKENVKEYLELDRKIELEVNTILESISKSISNNIPVTNKFGFIKGGGSCNGC